jgi:hypothetical protein
MNPKKKALGRGLSAILESPETDITSKDISGSFVVGAIASIPLNQIVSNPFQPSVKILSLKRSMIWLIPSKNRESFNPSPSERWVMINIS